MSSKNKNLTAKAGLFGIILGCGIATSLVGGPVVGCMTVVLMGLLAGAPLSE